MRRYLFYIAVGFLAFGIGLFVVLKFHRTTREKPIKEESNITIETQPEQNIGRGFGTGEGNKRFNEPVYVPKLHKATCSDKKLLPIWNELKKDKEFQTRATKEFYSEADCSIMLDIKEIDLNNDGRKEIVIQGNNPNLCARDDCLVWIFERKGSNYKQILQSWAISDAEVSSYTDERGLKIGETKTNGYKTITAIGGRSALRIQHTYQFNGKRYEETECLTFEYSFAEEPDVKTCKEYGL